MNDQTEKLDINELSEFLQGTDFTSENIDNLYTCDYGNSSYCFNKTDTSEPFYLYLSDDEGAASRVDGLFKEKGIASLLDENLDEENICMFDDDDNDEDNIILTNDDLNPNPIFNNITDLKPKFPALDEFNADTIYEHSEEDELIRFQKLLNNKLESLLHFMKNTERSRYLLAKHSLRYMNYLVQSRDSKAFTGRPMNTERKDDLIPTLPPMNDISNTVNLSREKKAVNRQRGKRRQQKIGPVPINNTKDKSHKKLKTYYNPSSLNYNAIASGMN